MPNFSQIARVVDADILLRAATPDFVAINAAYMRGDHFREGEEWIGPMPPEEMRSEGLRDLKEKFTPAPVVNECLENHALGIVGRKVHYEVVAKPTKEKVTPESAQQQEQERGQINDAIHDWCKSNNLNALLQEWVIRLRWATRGTFRLYVPPDLMEDGGDGVLKLPDDVKEPQDALKYIYLDAPNVEAAMVYTDLRSKRECGLFRYEEIDTPLGVANALQGLQTKRRVEKVFVADRDAKERGAGRPNILRQKTVLQVLETAQATNTDLLPSGGDEVSRPDEVVREVVFECGGYSLMFEAKLPLLLTDPARRLQRAVNLENTIGVINSIYAGFRSRDYFNVTDSRSEANGEGGDDIQNGPAQALMWYAFPYRKRNEDGSEGETQYLAPQLITTEPVDSKLLLELKNDLERQLRRAMRQEHTLYDGGTVSAVALIQMRAAFLVSLLQTKPAVESALVWLQGAVWCFALYLCGKEDQIPDFLSTYRVMAQATPYTGPLTPEEQRGIMEMVSARLIDREFASMLLGVDDVQVMLDKIDREDRENPDLMLKRLNVRKTLLDEGVKAELAAQLAGFDADTVKQLAPQTEVR